MFKVRKLFLFFLILPTLFWSSTAHALTLPESFKAYALSPALANSGIMLVDPLTSETLFENAPDQSRAPASVMKLLSATLASSVLDLDSQFQTTISRTTDSNRFTILGEFDPWLTFSSTEAQKYRAAYLPNLIKQAIQENPTSKRIVIDYYGLYDSDIEAAKKFFKKRVYLSVNKFPSAESIRAKSIGDIQTITSPTISDILKFAILWSDNTKADRLARLSARALGYSADAVGIQQAAEEIFPTLGISTDGLEIYDGAGLDKLNRVSARTVAQLLIRIKNDALFAPIIAGLPVAGQSGTLSRRYIKEAQSAAGLVKAKTGWINGTVSLAGYVTVKDEDYVFVVIADHVTPTEPHRKAARVAIDKMLATIAEPPSPLATDTLTQ